MHVQDSPPANESEGQSFLEEHADSLGLKSALTYNPSLYHEPNDQVSPEGHASSSIPEAALAPESLVIPLNVQEFDQQDDSHQIPIEEVVAHVDDLSSLEIVVQSDVALDPSQSYEHQNLEETSMGTDNETDPMLARQESNLRGTLDQDPFEHEDTFIIHSPEEPDDAVVDSNPSKSTESKSGQMTETVTQDDVNSVDNHSRRDEPAAQEAETFDDPISNMSQSAELYGESGPTETNKEAMSRPGELLNSVDVPDDLEDVDFDVDEELNAEFAALEASFQQSLTLSSSVESKTEFPHAQTSQTHAVELSSSRYAPAVDPAQRMPATNLFKSNSAYTPIDAIVPVQAFQVADVTSTSDSRSSLLRPVTLGYNAQTRLPNLYDKPVKSSTPSFVSGKVAYEDPYALPETLVTKKRLRPQAQAIRSVASVPNLKAGPIRPTGAQRHASAAIFQQQPPHPPPSHPHTLQEQASVPVANPVRPTTDRYRQAVTPSLQAVTTMEPKPSSDYTVVRAQPRPVPSFPSHGVHRSAQISSDQFRHPATQQELMHNSSASTPPIPFPVVSHVSSKGSDSRKSSLSQNGFYNAAGTAPLGAQAHVQPNASAYSSSGAETSYRMQGHLSSVATPGETHLQTHHPNPGPARQAQARHNSPRSMLRDSHVPGEVPNHERQFSEVSTQSGDSEVHRQEAYGDYLEGQRGAENQMFGDIYAVAQDDINEAQSTQRASHVGVSGTSLTYAQARPSTSPELQSQSSGDGQPVQAILQSPFTARRSLDEKSAPNAVQEMGRPLSRSTISRYANTEPSSSPRQSAVHLPSLSAKAPSVDIAQRRPPPLTRATTSSQPYPAFSQARSPSEFSSSLAGAQSDPSAGHPVASFGFGGKLLTTVPQTVPRFSLEGKMTTQIIGPGPILIRAVKEPSLREAFIDFPGPLLQTRNAAKQKRADLSLWLSKQIKDQEAAAQQQDRLLLYRILMLFLEHNGAFASIPAQRNLIQLLCPGAAKPDVDDMANFKVAVSMVPPDEASDQGSTISVSRLTDRSIDKLSGLLLQGDKDGALRYACDQHLWAHAMLLASRMSSETWQTVVREFSEIELNTPSESAENLKFLYQSFARSGQALEISSEFSDARKTKANSTAAAATNHHENRNWRKLLAMLLNNKADDSAIIALAQTLLSHDEVYAAHICFLVCARPPIGVGNDPRALFATLGFEMSSDDGWTSARNEAVIFSEIYEFLLSLAQPKFICLPHLLEFKLQRAYLLSDLGQANAAKRYCDGITNALRALPKGTAHLNHVLVGQLRELSHRLNQTHNEEGSSWLGSKIARPKIDNLWGSLEGKFSKFVAGEFEEAGVQEKFGSQGPFSRLAQTPALNRVQSIADFRNRGHLSSNDKPHGIHETEPPKTYFGASLPDQVSYPYRATDPSFSDQDLTANGPQFKQPYISTQQTPFQGPSAFHRNNSYSSANGTHPYMPPQNSGVEHSPFLPHSLPVLHGHQQDNVHHGLSAPIDPIEQLADNVHETAVNRADHLANADTELYEPQNSSELQNDSSSRVERASPLVERPLGDNPESTAIVKQSGEQQADDGGEEKKAGWLGSWFGGSKKKEGTSKESEAKVHKAKLGEGMSLVYDPVSKKWINPKGAMPEDAKSAAPPPPMSKKPARNDSATIHGVDGQSQVSDRNASSQLFSRVEPFVSHEKLSSGPTSRVTSGVSTTKKVLSAEDDLAAMLGSGPAPRRAASGGLPAGSTTNSVRAKRGKPAKKYVDVFQEG